MRFAVISTMFLAVTQPAASFAAGVTVVDLNAKPRPFSSADYDKMLACTLKSHPDETRRYSTYHLQRRDVQTPAQNESDPDSGLLLLALQGCFAIRNGEPFPFSLDRLIGDWGKAYDVSLPAPRPGIATTEELAVCAMQNDPQGIARMLAQPRPGGAIMNMSRLFGSRCTPVPNFRLDIDQLYSKLDQLTAEQAARKTVH